MAVSYNVLDELNSELKKAATPRASRKPVFLFLSEGQQARIRPLFNMDKLVRLNKHNKWAEQKDFRVNAVCAKEIGMSCVYCDMAATDKKMTAQKTFYLPVYVYSVLDTKTGLQVTMKDENGNEKPLQGIRVLEMTAYGSIGSVLTTFNNFYADPDYTHDITAQDFVIEQVSSGKTKKFTTIHKPAKPMQEQLVRATPTHDLVIARLLEACPPLVATDNDAPVVDAMPYPGEYEDVAPDF